MSHYTEAQLKEQWSKLNKIPLKKHPPNIKVEGPYLKNKDGSLRKDSLGRRIHFRSTLGFGGRPSHELNNVVTIRLNDEDKARLAAYAKGKKRSMADCLRDFMEWGLENDK